MDEREEVPQSNWVPVFPLGTVTFPGTVMPLHVFEDRYRAMVEHLLSLEPENRLLATVAIRDGYEVGDNGAQSLYRVGTLLRLTSVERRTNGEFDIEVTSLERMGVTDFDASAEFPQCRPELLPDQSAEIPDELAQRARAAFTAFRARVAEWAADPFSGSLPGDPADLGWALAGLVPLPLAERQALLEAADPLERLAMVTDLLRDELRAMNAIPSLPATEVARTSWSPN